MPLEATSPQHYILNSHSLALSYLSPMDQRNTFTREQVSGYGEAAPPSYEVATAPSSALPVPTSVDNLSREMERLQPLKTASSNRLTKPITIPATSKKLGSPFLRAYPPALEQFALPKDIFLRFVDDLNRMAVASPPIQVLGLAGSVVSMVPLHTAQIVGGAVNAASTIGVVAVSKGRTEVFLRQANKDIFQPRGLKVEVAKIDAIAKLTGMPILNDQGKVDKTASILPPIDSLEDPTMSGQDRRLQALEPWIARLDLTSLPDLETKTNLLSKLHAGASERQRGKEEKKMVKDRGKAHKDYDKKSREALEEYEKEMKKLDKEERKVHSHEKPKDVPKKLQEVQKERAKVEKEYKKELGKVSKDKLKDDKEEEGVRKILWLIIRNLDDGNESGPNPYLDDDTTNPEHIGTSTSGTY